MSIVQVGTGTAIGCAGALLHNAWDTQRAVPAIAGCAGSGASAVAYVVMQLALGKILPPLSIQLYSYPVGAALATQIGFPVSVEQCIIQMVIGCAALSVLQCFALAYQGRFLIRF